MTDMIETGIYWLPVTRNNWEIVPAWYLFTEGVDRFHQDDPHLVPSRHFGVITQQSYAELTGHRPVSNDIASKNMKHVEADDFVISMGSFESGIEYSPIAGKVSNDYRVLRPTEHVWPPYFRWFFKSRPLIDGLSGLTNEIRVGQRIHYSKFATLKLPLPPLQSQRRIAEYLDRETGEIDAMIDKLIELEERLTNRRRTIITSAVSGLGDRSAPVWKYADVNPTTPEFQELAEGEPLSFMPLEAIWPSKRAEYSGRIPWSRKLNYTQFRQGDLLIPKITPTFEAGRTIVARIPTNVGLASTEVHVVRPYSTTDARFLQYCFQSAPFLDEGAYSLKGVGNLRRVSPLFIRNHRILAASPEEQRRIADHLDKVTFKIDTMLTKVSELKDLLTERRAALITDVVTGRKDIA